MPSVMASLPYRWRRLWKFRNSIPCLSDDQCSSALQYTAKIGECKTWTQSEFCTCQNSIRGQEPLKMYIHRVSKKTSHLWLANNFGSHEWILIFFGRNVTDKVGNQKTLYYATRNNFCFCTTWQNAETRKSHISLNWIVLHTQCTCALSSWNKKIVICDVFDSI